jgi:hypothetical protein
MLLLGEIWFTVVKIDVHLGETCMYEYGLNWFQMDNENGCGFWI